MDAGRTGRCGARGRRWGDGGERYATPEMDGVEDLEFGAGGAWAMRAELGNSGIYLGQVLVCRDEEPLAAEATAYFGGFPEDRRPVQLAVHRDDGPVERFGRVMSGGLESGPVWMTAAISRDRRRRLPPGRAVSAGVGSTGRAGKRIRGACW